MAPERRRKRPPLAPLSEYEDAQPLLRHVRVMHAFMGEFVDERPELREHWNELFDGYMDILSRELAPYALMLALAIVELEDAYPEIRERPYRAKRP